MSSPASGPGLRVGTVAGAPIKIGTSWVLLAAVLVFMMAPGIRQQLPHLGNWSIAVALGYAVILLFSVLLHEVGHAVTARRFGQPVHAVVADLWGGHTSFDGRGLTPGSSAAIAAAGPVMNLALGGLAWLVHLRLPLGVPELLLYAAAMANLLLAGFNLLPGLPLDGGQILEALVWKVTGQRSRGATVAALFGRLVAVLVVVWFVLLPLVRGEGLGVGSLWVILVAGFLWRGASTSLTRGSLLAKMDAKRLNDLLLRVPSVQEAESLASAINRAPGGAIVVDAAQVPVGLLGPEVSQRVPADRLAHTPVSAAYTKQPADWLIDVDDEDLMPIVQHMAMHQLPFAVVRVRGQIAGLLQAPDVQRLLAD